MRGEIRRRIDREDRHDYERRPTLYHWEDLGPALARHSGRRQRDDPLKTAVKAHPHSQEVYSSFRLRVLVGFRFN